MEITTLEEGKELVYGYLEKSPIAGMNSIAFKNDGPKTNMEVTLHYQLRNVVSWLGWRLLGGKRYYKRLVVEAIRNLNALFVGD